MILKTLSIRKRRRLFQRFAFVLFLIGFYASLDNIFPTENDETLNRLRNFNEWKRGDSQITQSIKHNLKVDHSYRNDVNNIRKYVKDDPKPEQMDQNKSNQNKNGENNYHGNFKVQNVRNIPRQDQLEGRGFENRQEVDAEKTHDEQSEILKPEVSYPPFVKYNHEDGPGEYGLPYVPDLNKSEKKKMNETFSLNSFNVFISDRISVHRRLNDTRAEDCKNQRFRPNLPMASVILCFNNEAWSVLLRSVHSILDRTPGHLLREIILVDDGSTNEYLKEPLDRYMASYDRVKIVRAPAHEGLTRARLLGYSSARGPVLVFLDSHIECFPGWLEPMLERIEENPKIVPFPHIGQIDANTFKLQVEMASLVGIMDWPSLQFRWRDITEEEKKGRHSKAEPYRSPTMPGGLFAIHKDFFTSLGTYDPEFMFWGGENMELSFKVWMCGGSIEVIPCSQIGHIFRHSNPIKWPYESHIFITRNAMRVAEVWMDDYKDVFYDFTKKTEFGDVSDRKRLRESLHCNDFRWYVENILRIPPPPRALLKGEIRHSVKPVCFDSYGEKKIPAVYSCHGNGFAQWWVLRVDGALCNGLDCLCVDDRKLSLKMQCGSAQSFKYHSKNQTLVYVPSRLCIQLSVDLKLIMAECSGSSWQRWIIPQQQHSIDQS